VTRSNDVPGGPWTMRCDREGCETRSEEFPSSPALSIFAERGWFVAKLWGDRCPTCVAAGLVDKVEPHPCLPSPIDVVSTL